MIFSITLFKIRGWLLARLRRPETIVTSDGHKYEMDLTGRVVKEAELFPVVHDQERKVAFALMDNAVAHSYWRSQELSLFWRELDKFEQPVLDFGCGDGSFAKALTGDIAYGVDIDVTALAIAQSYKIYQKLLTFDQMGVDIFDGSLGTVFSCSVLEHTDDLVSCLHAIAKVLKVGGKFYFSVPSPHLTEHMAQLGGDGFAEIMNKRMYHRNMYDKDKWTQLLADQGLTVLKVVEFQSLAFTLKQFQLSLLGNRTIGRIPGFRKWFWSKYMPKIIAEVDASISGNVKNGANYFIVAEKSS